MRRRERTASADGQALRPPSMGYLWAEGQSVFEFGARKGKRPKAPGVALSARKRYHTGIVRHQDKQHFPRDGRLGPPAHSRKGLLFGCRKLFYLQQFRPPKEGALIPGKV